jgi:chitinase
MDSKEIFSVKQHWLDAAKKAGYTVRVLSKAGATEVWQAKKGDVIVGHFHNFYGAAQKNTKSTGSLDLSIETLTL